jgi:hypothetical protein
LKDLRKKNPLSLYQQVNMIAHQDIRLKAIVIPEFVISNNGQIPVEIVGTFEDLLSPVATGDHMEGALIFAPRFPCHGESILDYSLYVKKRSGLQGPSLEFFSEVIENLEEDTVTRSKK